MNFSVKIIFEFLKLQAIEIRRMLIIKLNKYNKYFKFINEIEFFRNCKGNKKWKFLNIEIFKKFFI